MILLLNPGACGTFMNELTQKVGSDLAGYGTVKWTDASEPEPIGDTPQGEGGCPFVFTDRAYVGKFAKLHQLCCADGSYFTLEKLWDVGLQTFLRRGYLRMIIDPESDHPIPMDRQGMAQLFAQVSLELFARLEELHVVTVNGEIHQQTLEGRRQLLVFENAQVTSIFLEHVRGQGRSETGTRSVPTLDLLRLFRREKIDELVVNPMIPDFRSYFRADVDAMLQLLEKDTRKAPDAESLPQLPNARPASAKPAVLERAEAARRYPPVPGPGRNGSASRAFFAELQRGLERGSIKPWQFMEAFAFEQDVHVLRHHSNVAGLAWPFMMSSPENPQEVMVPVFTSEEDARRLVSAKPAEFGGCHGLSGLEAIRWILSAPARIDRVGVDLWGYEDRASFPLAWGVYPLFPAFYALEEGLKQVPGTPLARLGQASGARGLKPQILRTLAMAWPQLFGLRVDSTTPPSVEYCQKLYLPVFTCQEQVFQYLSTSGGAGARPVGAAQVANRRPPYMTWLQAACGLEGVLIDPCSSSPLPLSHFDTLTIDAWARQPEKAPDPHDLFEAVASLRAAGQLSEEAAGRMVAEWPQYFVLTLDEGAGVSLLRVPGTSALTVFTREDLAKRQLEALRACGTLPIRPVQVNSCLSKWTMNVFLAARDSAAEIWIDPEPSEARGLRLGHAGIGSAIARLDELLMPRIPDFVWY
jgi:hypothetical protein